MKMSDLGFKKLSKDDIVYCSAVNLSGLWSKKPLKMVYLDEETGTYWDRSGDFSCPGLGIQAQWGGGFISFASKNKREVEVWIYGVSASMHLLKNWASFGYEFNTDK